jgi:hypothetical protein
MRAGMFHQSGSSFYWYFYANNAVFVNGCWYGIFGNDFGLINQYESTGASHTVHGHVDNSTNHTGRRPEGL